MRPTPAETASALGRLLDDWAADETQSQHMRWMLRRVSGVLQQTDWEDASAEIAASNARLMQAIDAGVQWIDALEAAVAEQYTPARKVMSGALETGADRPAEQASLQERNELNAILREAADAFVCALEADRAPDGEQGRRRRGYACLVESLGDL